MSNQRKPAAAKSAAAAKKVIFNARPAAARLSALKKAAEDAGEVDTRWWAPALEFDWTAPRDGNNGTRWVSVSYKDESAVTGRLVLRINGEKHTGQIMPNTDPGVAELAARVKNPKAKIEKRTKKPSIQIQKWAAQVKTAEDGITLLVDGDGNAILPDDSTLSPYYQVASLVGEAFAFEAKERVDRGTALVTKVVDVKKKDKAATAPAILEAFVADNGPRRPGDMVISSEAVATLRKLFPNPKDTEVLTKGATIASSTRIALLTQEFISDKAVKNAGLPLPNPLARVAMNFDKDSGLAQMAFFDKGQPYTEEGRQKYENGKVDGDPVDADNVHKFVLSRSTLDGIINMDSVCFSSMGISMPVKAEVLVVAQPSGRGTTFDDVYDDEDGFSYGSADAEEGGAAPPPAPAAAAAKAPPADDANYDDLLGELSGDTVKGRDAK